jgi:hypothetical protein
MTFDETLAQVLDLLQREGRVSYRALKRRFGLDDDYLADLKDEIIEAKQVARDERGTVLVWMGGPVAASRAPRLMRLPLSRARHRPGLRNPRGLPSIIPTTTAPWSPSGGMIPG